MTALSYTFEGGADEATITTSDTGSGDAFNVVNIPAQGGSPSAAEVKYDTAWFSNGAVGSRIRTTDAGGAFYAWTVTGATTYARLYHKRATSLPATRQFVQMRDGAAAIATVRMTTGGNITLNDRGNTARYTSAKAFASAEEFRIEIHFAHSLTAGHMEARLFYGSNLHGTTPDETLGNQTDNWDTGSGLAQIRFGMITAAAVGTNETYPFDEIAFSDVDWIGPSTTGGGGGGGGGTGAGFPLVAPTTTGWTTLRDPNPSATWTPSLAAGTDYVLAGPVGMSPWVRTARLNISGGRNVYVDGLRIDGGNSTTMLNVEVGSSQRDVFLHNMWLTNSAARQTDGIRTSNAAGGNATTGSGGTILKLKNCRIDDLVGTQDGVHADCIQLSGGIKELWLDDCTFESGYVALQLQREQVVTGSARTITALSRTGTTASVTVLTGLDLQLGDWVELNGTTPTTWMGTFQVTAITSGAAPTVTGFQVFLGDGGQAAWTSGGTAQKSIFGYYVGDVHMNDVNMRSMANAFPPPSEQLTAMRINAGRPDQKGSGAEDRTPLLVDGMSGILDLTNVYADPNAGETLADALEPSTSATVYSLARGSLNTVPTPDEYSWPDHPKVTGVVKHGVPAGGDFAPLPGGAPSVTASMTQTMEGFVQNLDAAVGLAASLAQTMPEFSQVLTAEAGTPVAAATGAPSLRTEGLPDVSWTIGDEPVEVQGWAPSISEGGYDQMRGTISEEAWLMLEASGIRQGAVVKGWAGEQFWEGRLSTTPLTHDGVAQIAAQGEKFAAAKKDDRLFIQSRGVKGWTPADSDPHLNDAGNNVYPASKKIDVSLTGSRALFRVDRNESLAARNRAGIVFYAEGVELARVAWVQNYAVADETGNLKFQPYRANGPIGAETEIGTGRLTNASNNGALFDVSFPDDAQDLVGVQLEVVNGFTPTEVGAYRLAKLRVNSAVNLTDTMDASAVAAYIGGQFGWDTSGVQSSSFNVLPFDWDGDWLAALLYVAELEDKYARVVEGPRLEYGTWGDVTWEVAKAQGADVQLTPLERYDRVEVWYEAASGVRRRAVTEDTSLGFGNTYKYDLNDRQDDATLAQAVAAVLFTRLSAQRYVGRVRVVAARSNTGSRNPYLIRYGDHLTITDFGPGEALTQRVMEAQYGPDGVTVGIEAPVSPLQVIADLVSLRNKTRIRRKGAA